MYGIYDALLSWISAFLTGKLQCVVLGNKLSSVLSGIAQGSVLGPLLFILFVNDLTDIFGNEADSKLFADDLKLYSSYELSSANLLQNALDKLVKWSADWQLSLNPLKSNVLYLGKSNSKSVYTIKNVEIVSSDLVRDLGIGVDCGLKFSCHVQNIVTLSYQRLAVLFRGFCSRDTSILVRAYKYMCDLSWNTVRQFGLHINFMRLTKLKECSDILRVGCRVSNHL